MVRFPEDNICPLLTSGHGVILKQPVLTLRVAFGFETTPTGRWISTPSLRPSRSPRRRHRCAPTRPFERRLSKRSVGWMTASGRRSKSRALSFVPRLLQHARRRTGRRGCSTCYACVLHAASSARLGTDSALISVSSYSGGGGPLSSCRWRLARPRRVPPKWTRRRSRAWILTMERPSTLAEARPPSPPPPSPPESGTVASPLVPAVPHLHALRRKRRHRRYRPRHRREAHPQRLGG